VILLAALVAWAPDARAETLDGVVARAVRGNYEALHGCFRRALAEDRNRGGTLFVKVTLGAGDAVRAAGVAKDGLGHKEVAGCILGWVRGWTLRGAAGAGAGPGSEITIPLTFRPAPRQFAVRLEDAPLVRVSPALEQRRVLSPRNAGAGKAMLTWLRLRGRCQLPAVQADDRVLYVLRGKGRARRPGRRLPLRAGSTLWAPGGAEVELDGELEALLVAAPAASAAPLKERRRRERPVLRRPPRLARVGPRGQVRVWPLLSRRRIYVGVVRGAAGYVLATHRHAAGAELVYVLEGSAEVTVEGSGKQAVGPGHALYLPAGVEHGLRVVKPLRALQVYAPAGPERRYKNFRRGGK
jgi:quercetin dioxygenase-like cupin family protein